MMLRRRGRVMRLGTSVIGLLSLALSCNSAAPPRHASPAPAASAAASAPSTTPPSAPSSAPSTSRSAAAEPTNEPADPITAAEAALRAALAAATPRGDWTTAPRTDTCTTPSGASRDYPRFDSREACEQWVAVRRCRPGFACYDGCNWRGCDRTGQHMTMTLLACDARFYDAIDFEPGRARALPPPNLPDLLSRMSELLRAPDRKLRIIGYAEADEASSAGAQKQLAQARAQAARQLLLKHGIQASRLLVELGDVQALRDEGYTGSLTRALLTVDRREPIQADFAPESSEYQRFCGAPGVGLR